MMRDAEKLLSNAIFLENDNLTHNLWGGDWIIKWKGLRAERLGPVGESWEFSGHKAHPNFIRLPNGRKVSLPWLIDRYPKEVLGPRILKKFGRQAPFLVKLIDAKETLSLQVHPDDDYSKRNEREVGKFESWIIVGVAKGRDSGKIYLGFNKQKAQNFKNPDQFRKAFLETMEKTNRLGPSFDPIIRARAGEFVLPFVNEIRAKPGDVFELPPGTIHAIGKGVRIFEIQKPSNITYRIWDWNRPDTGAINGPLRFRTLHLDKAAAVLNFLRKDAGELHHKKYWARRSAGGRWLEENLIHNPRAHYAVNRIVMSGKNTSRPVLTKNEFYVLTVIEGRVRLNQKSTGRAGQSILVPASAGQITLTNLASKTILYKSYCL